MMKSRNSSVPSLESLETRTLMSATGYPSATFVYTESNNPNAGKNAILAYRENTATGALSPDGSYLTGGTGYRNVGPKLGPDDSDKEVIASPDGRFLFAVNQGSNSVSVFNILPNGELAIVRGGPFNSGGVQPVSLSFSNDHLYVVNRGNSAEGAPGTIAPSVSIFTVGEDGQLFAVPHSTITLPLNLSTAQVEVSADGKFAFIDNFATPSNLKVSLANTIEPFVINADGTLTAVQNGSAGLPTAPPLLLGLAENSADHLVYAGRPALGGISTFTYDSAGKLTYVGATPEQGKATCWLTISPNGKFLYATDSGSDAVSVYSLANPLKPVFIQEFKLNGPVDPAGSSKAIAAESADFQLSFDSTGHYLYIVNHTTNDAFQKGNQLHTLEVGANGMLSETDTSPIFFPSSLVPATAHVMGLAVVSPFWG